MGSAAGHGATGTRPLPGISVGIVEDDKAVRDRIERGIRKSARLTPVFAVATVSEAIAAADRHSPTIVLVDICLPDGSGLAVIDHLREKKSKTLAMVISALGDEASIVSALKAGALGYLLKDDSAEMIETAIDELVRGGSPISPAVARHLIRRFRQPASAAGPGGAHSADTLTPRELDVLTLSAKGYSYQEVADLLGVTANTVRCYTKRIYEKLAVNSRSEALFEAMSMGLLVPPTKER